MSTNNNKRILHRKEFQMMTPAILSAGVGTIFIGDDSARNRFTLQHSGVSTHYLYDHEEDAWITLPSGGFAGTFGAGSAGQYFPWSIDIQASTGSTTQMTGTASLYNLTRFIKGNTIEFVSGNNLGRTASVVDMINNGINWTIFLDTTLPFSVSNEFFRINSGRIFVLNAYLTLAAGVFKAFDIATMTWGPNLATTSLPAAWGTDGAMTTPYQFNNPYVVGTASSATSNTLVDSTASWTASNFINYQVKIIGGTGLGQARRISANTNTTITLTGTWSVPPTVGSQYIIESSEDLYLWGNGSTPLYRYTVASQIGATVEGWTTSVAAAPASAGNGCTLDAIVGATESTWTNRNNLLNGRYLYALRGSGNTTLYRYDITTNTWITYGSGGVSNYVPLAESFSTGTSAMAIGSRIYIRKDATNRFFYYDVVANDLVPFSTNLYGDSTGVVGQKIWIKKYDDQTMWLYSMRNSDVILHRIMMF